jgi:hypothetical protein
MARKVRALRQIFCIHNCLLIIGLDQRETIRGITDGTCARSGTETS